MAEGLMSCSGCVHKELDHSMKNRGQPQRGRLCGVCGEMTGDHRETSGRGDGGDEIRDYLE